MDTSSAPDATAPPPGARLPAARRYLRRIRPAEKQRQQQQQQQRGRGSPFHPAASGASPPPSAAAAADDDFSPSQSSSNPRGLSVLTSHAEASRTVAPVINFEGFNFDSSTTAANPFSIPQGSVFTSLDRQPLDAAAPIFTAGTAALRTDDARPVTPPIPSAEIAATPACDSRSVADAWAAKDIFATERWSEGGEGGDRSCVSGIAGTEGNEQGGERFGVSEPDEVRVRESELDRGVGGAGGCEDDGFEGQSRAGDDRIGEDSNHEGRNEEGGNEAYDFHEFGNSEGRCGDGRSDDGSCLRNGEGGGDEGNEGEGEAGATDEGDERAEDEGESVEDDAIAGNSIEDDDAEEESEEGEEGDSDSDRSSRPSRAPSPLLPSNLNPLALLALSHAPLPPASSLTSTTFSGGTSPTLSSTAAASSLSAVSPPNSPSAPSPFPPFSVASSYPKPHPRPPTAAVNMVSLTASQKFAKLLQQLAKQSAELSELRGELADAKGEVAEMQAVVARAGLDFVRERMEKERLGQACAKLNNALLSSRRETADERERRELAERLAVAAELARRQLVEEITVERAQLARADNWREHNLHLKLVEAQMVLSEKAGILEVLHAELARKFRMVAGRQLWQGEEERPFGWFLKFLGQPEGKAWLVEGLQVKGEGEGEGEEGGSGKKAEKGKGKVEEGSGSGSGGSGSIDDDVRGSPSHVAAAPSSAAADEAGSRGGTDSGGGSSESEGDDDDSDRTAGSAASPSEAVPLVGGGGDELRIPKLRDRSGNAGSSSSGARIAGRGGGSRCRWRGDMEGDDPLWQRGYNVCSACGHGRGSAVAAATAAMDCGVFNCCRGRGGRSMASGVGGNGSNSAGWLGLSSLASFCNPQWRVAAASVCATAAAVTVASVNSVCGRQRTAAGGGAGRIEEGSVAAVWPFSSCFGSQYATLSATHDDMDADDDDAGGRDGRAAEARPCGCMHGSRLGPKQGSSSRGTLIEMTGFGSEDESVERRGKGRASALLPPRPQRAARGGEGGCGGGAYCKCCGRCCECRSSNQIM